MDKIETVHGTFTHIEDSVEPPPPTMLTSKFKNLGEWLTHIAKNEKPNKAIKHFKIGLFESAEENVLYLAGYNESNIGNTSRSTIDFEPKEMYYLLPSDSYKGLSREKLIATITDQLKNFTEKDLFKASFFYNANSFVFETTGKIIWEK